MGSCRDRTFYVATRLARVGRISVATEDFYVVTKLATIESSTAHDRARYAKAGRAHDTGLRAQPGGLGHATECACATQVFYRNRLV